MADGVAVALRTDFDQSFTRQPSWVDNSMGLFRFGILPMKVNMGLARTMAPFTGDTQQHVFSTIDVCGARDVLEPSIMALKTSQS